MKLMCTACNLF